MSMTRHDAYHAHPALSATKIKCMVAGPPRSYWARHEAPPEWHVPFVRTDPMRQGSLVDLLTFEPQEFPNVYAVLPDEAPKRPTASQLKAKKPSDASIEAIAWWKGFDAETVGKELISRDWFVNACEIIDVLEEDETFAPILAADRLSQEPHYWIDREFGVECRYLPDIENKDLIDLKKGASAHPRTFSAQLYKLGYDVQLAHYREGYFDRNGCYPERMGFAVYEWQRPHNCSVVWINDDYIEHGMSRRHDAIRAILDGRESGKWPSYGESLVGPPAYAEMDNADAESDLSELELVF